MKYLSIQSSRLSKSSPQQSLMPHPLSFRGNAIFSLTVRNGTSPPTCSMKPTDPALITESVLSSASLSMTLALPSGFLPIIMELFTPCSSGSGRVMRPAAWRSVLFPEPLGPLITATPPSFTERCLTRTWNASLSFPLVILTLLSSNITAAFSVEQDIRHRHGRHPPQGRSTCQYPRCTFCSSGACCSCS